MYAYIPQMYMLGTTWTLDKLVIFFSVMRSYELNISSNSTKFSKVVPIYIRNMMYKLLSFMIYITIHHKAFVHDDFHIY